MVRLLEDPNQRAWAHIFYWCAVAVGVPSLAAASMIRAEFWWGVLPALLCLVVGRVVAVRNRHTRLDFARKLVVQRKGGTTLHAIPFDDLVSVAASAYTVLVRTRESTVEVPRFSLTLLVVDASDSLRETIAGMRRDRVAIIRDGVKQGVHELLPRLEHAVSAHALALVDTTDEALVWQVAEWLAKTLDLPLVDACTSPMALRVPEELDLPLGERLARGLQEIDVTAAYASSTVPEGASVEQRGGSCTLSWCRNHWPNMLYLVGFTLLFPCLGLLFYGHEDAGWLWFALCAVIGSIFLPLIAVASRWHGANRITVSRKSVVVVRGPRGKRLPPLATDSVEAVRIGGTKEEPLLTLVSDEGVLRLPMEPTIARWAKQHIERHLRLLYANEAKRLARRGQAE